MTHSDLQELITLTEFISKRRNGFWFSFYKTIEAQGASVRRADLDAIDERLGKVLDHAFANNPYSKSTSFNQLDKAVLAAAYDYWHEEPPATSLQATNADYGRNSYPVRTLRPEYTDALDPNQVILRGQFYLMRRTEDGFEYPFGCRYMPLWVDKDYLNEQCPGWQNRVIDAEQLGVDSRAMALLVLKEPP